MKNVFQSVIAGVMLMGLHACAQKTEISVTELPKNAQTFLSKKSFPNQAASYVIKDKEITETEYTVMLSGGTEIEFDEKGEWKEIDGNKSALPDIVIPTSILNYTTQHYKGVGVEKIEKKPYGFKIELLNGLEIEFDKQGKFIGVDD